MNLAEKLYICYVFIEFPNVLLMIDTMYKQICCRYIAMVHDSILPSRMRSSSSFRRQFAKNELGSWSTLFKRHRFLLTVLALLIILCTVYLYFAISFETRDPCAGLRGPQKASCHMELVKTKLRTAHRHFWFFKYSFKFYVRSVKCVLLVTHCFMYTNTTVKCTMCVESISFIV